MQLTTLRFPETSRLNMPSLARAFSRWLLRPLESLADALCFVLGTWFVVDFLLRVIPTPALESLGAVAFFRELTAPALAPWREALRRTGLFSPDADQALPLALALLIWLGRPVLRKNLREMRWRLEQAPLESLFLPRPAETVWEESEASPAMAMFSSEEFSSARLLDTEAGEPAATPILTSANHALQTIGRYELLQEMGRGSASAVYKALDLKLGRIVAVKFLLPGDLSPEQLREHRQKLYHEARTAAKLVHPGIVAVFDVAEDSLGNPYIVMEYAEGETLAQAIHPHGPREPLSLPERMEIARQLAKALHYAHRCGVIHRDIKPSNILITAEGDAKITDFGIARHVNGGEDNRDRVPGTPAFVAPELLRGAAATAASDIFALGVVLYWMFTGELPFSGNTVTEIVHQVMHASPPPARRLNWALPQELDRILARCLAKKPAERYRAAGELAAELTALRDGRLESARLSA